jgi:PAS domain S-box-containing protein
MSLAIRLLLIVLLAVLPAILLGVYSEYNARQGREAEVRREAVRRAGQLASEMKQIIEGVQRVALTLAQVPAITDAASAGSGQSADCSGMLAQLGRDYPGGIGLGVANSDAELVCAAGPVPPGTRVMGEHFTRAMETGGFVVGGYGEGSNGVAYLSFAQPLFDELGQGIGAVVLGIDLGWLADHMEERYAGTNVSLSMADRNLVYLLRIPEEPVRIVGQPALEEHRGLAALADQGALEARGADGVMRVGAITSLAFSGSGSYDLLLGFGISRNAAFAPIEVAARNALLLLALCLLLALAAAWLGGRYLVRRPAEGLLAAAARWREGDYAKRVEAEAHGEFGQLGRAFNDMAMSIEDRTNQLQASEERFRTLAALVPSFVWFADPDGTLRYANERWFAYTGAVPVEGATIPWADALHPEDADRAMTAWREAISEETPYEVEFRLRETSGVYRWFLSRAVPLRDARGRVTGWFGTSTDIDKLTQATEHRALLIDELNHRVKNTLATVQSLAAQSLQGTSLPQARKILEGRLLALARSHDVLTREYWQSARLREIVEQSVSPSNGGERERFNIEGPDIDIPPRMALGFSMALHELLVNALKFGALTTDTGFVTIGWHVQPDGSGSRLHLRWQEAGGPPVAEKKKRGFGTRLITSGLGRELGGEVNLCFEPEGVVCTFDLPLVKASSERDIRGVGNGPRDDGVNRSDRKWLEG